MRRRHLFGISADRVIGLKHFRSEGRQHSAPAAGPTPRRLDQRIRKRAVEILHQCGGLLDRHAEAFARLADRPLLFDGAQQIGLAGAQLDPRRQIDADMQMRPSHGPVYHTGR